MSMNSKIIKEILKSLPEGSISDAAFEGANIVLYTKDKDYFFDNKGSIKKVVDDIKKRVELRPDPSLCMDEEKAEKVIRQILPEEAAITQIIFDHPRSIVIIEAEKPGLAIGKQGSLLKDIRQQTLWVPIIKRTPAIKSQIIENIRSVLYQNNDYRKKFLDKTGERIYNGWIRGKKEEWVRITYLGAGRQVGRSCFLLQTPESRILLDCGIDPADDANAYPLLEAPEFRIEELDAVIITHSHLDHCGFLPYLYKYGYRGPIYCTLPTRDVMSLLMLDFVKIQVSEGKNPIYTSEEIKEMVKHTITLDFEEVTDITPDVRITLYNAGHILGSAMVHLHIGNGLHNLLYTGDLKFAKTDLLDPAATTFPRLETLIIEATYGGKDNNQPSQAEADALLSEVIIRTIERGGKILIPTLGSGRSQEIMILIERLVREGKMPKVPVYIDGMVWDITAIHTAYPEYLNSKVRREIFHENNNPFLADFFKRVGSAKERQQIIEEHGACVILATSGMLVGGPSVEYLKQLASDKRHTLMFSCYQPEGSMGRRILNGDKELNFGSIAKPEIVHLKMEVLKLEISGHSDRRQLINFVHRCSPRPKKILITHGENSRCLDLASTLHKSARVETMAPRNLESVRLR